MSAFRGANPFHLLPMGVRSLLIANCAVFLVQIIIPANMVGYLGLTPLLVVKEFWFWQIVTYSFLHGSGWHIFFNMFALWMFGPPIESRWGTRSFVTYYFLCSTGAALTQFLVAPAQLVVGSSGAIYGILLAFGFLFPDAVIHLFFVFPFRAIQAVAVIALFSFISALSSGGSRIAHFAHLGGLATGFLYFKVPVWRDRFRLWRFQRILSRPMDALREHRDKKTQKKKEDLTQEVDRILEKISSQGVSSLTPEEHETMQRYAQKKH